MSEGKRRSEVRETKAVEGYMTLEKDGCWVVDSYGDNKGGEGKYLCKDRSSEKVQALARTEECDY